MTLPQGFQTTVLLLPLLDGGPPVGKHPLKLLIGSLVDRNRQDRSQARGRQLRPIPWLPPIDIVPDCWFGCRRCSIPRETDGF